MDALTPNEVRRDPSAADDTQPDATAVRAGTAGRSTTGDASADVILGSPGITGPGIAAGVDDIARTDGIGARGGTPLSAGFRSGGAGLRSDGKAAADAIATVSLGASDAAAGFAAESASGNGGITLLAFGDPGAAATVAASRDTGISASATWLTGTLRPTTSSTHPSRWSIPGRRSASSISSRWPTAPKPPRMPSRASRSTPTIRRKSSPGCLALPAHCIS